MFCIWSNNVFIYFSIAAFISLVNGIRLPMRSSTPNNSEWFPTEKSRLRDYRKHDPPQYEYEWTVKGTANAQHRQKTE